MVIIFFGDVAFHIRWLASLKHVGKASKRVFSSSAPKAFKSDIFRLSLTKFVGSVR